jgi:hypothetical protein
VFDGNSLSEEFKSLKTGDYLWFLNKHNPQQGYGVYEIEIPLAYDVGPQTYIYVNEASYNVTDAFVVRAVPVAYDNSIVVWPIETFPYNFEVEIHAARSERGWGGSYLSLQNLMGLGNNCNSCNTIYDCDYLAFINPADDPFECCVNGTCQEQNGPLQTWCCDDAYELDPTLTCAVMEADFAFDCSGCACPGDVVEDPTCSETSCGYWLENGYSCADLETYGIDCNICDVEDLCTFDIPGCMDPNACNYLPAATTNLSVVCEYTSCLTHKIIGFFLGAGPVPAGCGTLLYIDTQGTPTGLADIVVGDMEGAALPFEYYSESVEDGCGLPDSE